MFVAKTNHGEKIFAQNYQGGMGKQLYCPGCEGRVIFKKGSKTLPHFAHVSLGRCASFSEGETQEHLAGKELLYHWTKSATLEAYLPKLQQRPDLLWGKLAIEVQCSPLAFERFFARTNNYLTHGYLPWWLLGEKLRPNKKWHTLQKACCYYQQEQGLKLWSFEIKQKELRLYHHIQWHFSRVYHYELLHFSYPSNSIKQILSVKPIQREKMIWDSRQFKYTLKKKLLRLDQRTLQLQEKLYLRGGHLLYLPDECYKASRYFFFFEEELLYLRFCLTQVTTIQEWYQLIQPSHMIWPYPLVSQKEILEGVYQEFTKNR